ncbi:bifunctional diaminohydroxyphosphoribosylaminopyrimidine deaminase/5-amino-6-(5-phosphoribosylamino)uracil reductase RibD [Actinosynnema sp. CS-041913]|uniref:bifunctional diaminohydroxyphosphoribosylaminopyrimidine deaminase/5-amino-6-(5-phosphoribosylamino)uracil reductase RibD n=1 Tax=Actinosynnema sp. CS-041913 TaxID=3239917 RepID=UPI003D8DED1F
MTASEPEISAMHRAIALSAFGLGHTSPNPPVGCVILDPTGRVVGEGYHQRKGEPHAEVHALTAAGQRARGGTAVVTLEPCNHHGRTPPCRQALIDAGIARTVIALIDPTSREEGGAARLRAAGIDVEVGVLADTARLVLGPWLDSLRTRRPHVTWLYRSDSDGRIAVATASQVAALATGVDVVVHADGRVVEAQPNSHDTDTFSIPEPQPGTDPADRLARLHDAGTRTILLVADPDSAASFLHRGLVDRVVVQLHPQSPSHRPPSDGLLSLVPRGFAIDRVTRDGRNVRVGAYRQDLPRP